MKRASGLVIVMMASAVAAGCFGFERKSTLGPSATGISALLGSWTSANLVPQPDQCSDFKWDVTEQTANSAKGSFSAACAGDLKINGTAQGTLSGSIINWSAQGNGSLPGLPSCAITLAGTAELQVDAIRVPYSGDTCLGKVSGVEILRKR